MGHTLWYGAGKELASNLTAAWCRDSNTMAGIPCFVQKLPGLTHCTLTSDDNRTLPSREVPGGPGKVPGRDRTGPRDLEGPVVPWSRDLTSPKVPGLENWKSPGTMETLVWP